MLPRLKRHKVTSSNRWKRAEIAVAYRCGTFAGRSTKINPLQFPASDALFTQRNNIDSKTLRRCRRRMDAINKRPAWGETQMNITRSRRHGPVVL
jgi:hypothetical protein